MSEQLCVIPHRDGRERRATDGVYLCRGHQHSLPDRLLDLADLYDELADQLIRQSTNTEKVSSSRDSVGINLDRAVFEIRDTIRNELAGWARVVCEERGHHPPNDDTTSIARFLSLNADWLAAQPFIDDLWASLIADPDAVERDQELRQKLRRERDGYVLPDYPSKLPGFNAVIKKADHTDSRALTHKARSLIQPAGRKRIDFEKQHRCLHAECTGFLIAVARDVDELLPSKVWCESCGQEWPAGSWLTLGRKLRERDSA